MKKLTTISTLVLLTALQLVAQAQNYGRASQYLAVNTKAIDSATAIATHTDTEISKTFTKSFSVNSSDKVSISHQYGNITIKTWDKNEVKVDVLVTAYSSNNDAQNLLNGINFSAEKDGNGVAIKTGLSGHKGNYGSGKRKGNNWRREVTINTTLYMPAANPLNIDNQYGNVTLDHLSGPTAIKVQYGNFTAVSLSNSNNFINVQYGKCSIQDLATGTVKHQYNGPVNIGTAGTLTLDAQYTGVIIGAIRKSAVIKVQYGSGLTVGNIGGNLILDADYAKVNLASVKGNAVINQAYGNLKADNLSKLVLKAAYSAVNMGALNGDAEIRISYNDLNVKTISNSCKKLTIDADYTDINLGFDNRYDANFNVKTSYAGFNCDGVAKIGSTNKDNEEKNYSGKIGNGGSATVMVKADYGSVSFK